MQRKRDDMIRASANKNLMVRDLVSDVGRKQDYTLQPITYEDHIEEWKQDLKRQKRVKAAGGGSD